MEGIGRCVRTEGVDEGKKGKATTRAGEEEEVENETEKEEAEEEEEEEEE